MTTDQPDNQLNSSAAPAEQPASQPKPVQSPAFTAEGRAIKPGSFAVELPSDQQSALTEKVREAQALQNISDGEAKQWLQNVTNGQELTTLANEDGHHEFEGRMDNWKESDASDIGGFVRYRDITALRGDDQILSIQNSLGLGASVWLFLNHSGFGIRIKPISDTAQADLYRLKTEDTIIFGRRSYGISHTLYNYQTVAWLTDLVLAHVLETTIKAGPEPVNLRALIDPRDIPVLLAGAVAASNPNGVPYQRTCTNDIGACTNSVTGLLHILKTYRCDAAFDADMRAHMSQRKANSHSLESIAVYKAKLNAMTSTERYLGGEFADGPTKIKLTFKPISIAEYTAAGMAWFEEAAMATANVIRYDAVTDVSKNMHINTLTDAATLRRYGHYISKITVETEGGVSEVSTTSEINKVLASFSQDSSLVNQVNAAAMDYVEKSTIGGFGIAPYECSNCKTKDIPQADPTKIIPLDMMTLFFQYHTHRVSLIAARAAR